MESGRLCAYNQTRECFLGLEVTVADLSVAELKEVLGRLTLKSGEGLWMAPFRGIPEMELRFPLDLIYLDEECRVIGVVESFPTFRIAPFAPHPATVLALPTHSIYSSQTQSEDQLMLCGANEMQRRLETLSGGSSISGVVQSAVLLRSKPLWSGGRAVVELESSIDHEDLIDHEDRIDDADRHADRIDHKEQPAPEPIYEMELVKPGIKTVKPPKSWLERWWSPNPKEAPDPRKAPRDKDPGLAAYYWNGSAPRAHTIRDISASGIYVVTEERWYPGTLILMTLQEPGSGTEVTESAISVHSKAIRWGKDGVGLQFIPTDTPEAHNGLNRLSHGADRQMLDQFLQRYFKSRD